MHHLHTTILVRRTAWILLLATTFAQCAQAKIVQDRTRSEILYVDDDAPPGGDGSSWTTAFATLQDALAAANDPGSEVAEIRIGQGTYKPDQGAGQTPGNVQATFAVSGIAVRGGYAGFGAADPEVRDFVRFESVLTGDLLGDDGPPGSFQNYQDNSYHIMTVADTDGSTTIEGLSFTAANVDWDDATLGGGIVSYGGNPYITNCAFRFNWSYVGGALVLYRSDATIIECEVVGNRAGAGAGGIIVADSSPHITKCRFVGNYAPMAANAGALYLSRGAPIITECDFIHNTSGGNGGAVVSYNSAGYWRDCRFINNGCSDHGGGFWSGLFQSACNTFVECDFIGNYAGQHSGGVGTPIGLFINCNFVENFSSFEGGAGLRGGGTLINCEFRRNTSGGSSFKAGGAGAWLTVDSSLFNCVFNANDSWGWGGGAYVAPNINASFTNCTFTNNITTGDSGGAISGHARIDNSVLWNNSPDELYGAFEIGFSCIEGGWAGNGNTLANPQFVDAIGPDGIPGTPDDNLRLTAVSPCIDSADNTAVPRDVFDLDDDGNTTERLPIDADGAFRFIDYHCATDVGNSDDTNFICDMGAFEFRPIGAAAADVTCDGVVNVNDLLAVINAWGPCPKLPPSCPADIAPPPTGDGAVNVNDLLMVINNWG